MEESPKSTWKPVSILVALVAVVGLGIWITRPQDNVHEEGRGVEIQPVDLGGGPGGPSSEQLTVGEELGDLPPPEAKVRLDLDLVRIGDLDDGDVLRPFAFSPFRGSISGTVWSGIDRRAVEGVHVEIVGGPLNGRHTTTDVRGRYELDRMPPGRTFLRFQSMERSPFTHVVRVVDGEAVHHDVSLVTGHPLYGLVRAHSGERLKGVVVEADGVRVETDEGGRFVLAGAGGGEPTYLYLSKKGYRTARLVVDLSEPRTNPEEPLETHMFEGGSIQIDLQGFTSEIAPRVSVLPRDGDLNGEVPFERFQDLEAPLAGVFTVDGLPERGMFRVLVHHPRARAVPAEQPVFLAGGRSVRKVVFRLDPGQIVSGRITAKGSDDGLKDVRVRVEPADPWAQMEQDLGALQADRLPLPSFSAWSAEALTNWNGEFQIEMGVNASSWRVVAELEAYEPAVVVVPEAARERVTLSLEPHRKHRGTLSVRLRPGRDLDWKVTVDGLDTYASGSAKLGERFEILNLPPGKYRVHPKFNDVPLPPVDISVPRASRGIADLDIDLAG